MTNYPKIGIRPTIDGRRNGVRESLEEQTMNMAKSVAELISANLKYPDGTPVECVISPSTIGRVPEAAASHELFKRSNICGTITVTPCWCYGSETMDMSPDIPHAIWGFNGTERPGAVYLAAVLASHAQKGIPAFGIYGKDVKDSTDTEIPEDVREKILRYVRAAISKGIMRDKSYLSMGNVSMGIGGSIVDADFFQEYLGMRNEYIDMSEFIRRLEEGIYDHEEYERALAWVKEHVKEGIDRNREDLVLSAEEKERQWEFVVKMFIIGRDLMIGNPRLAELGFVEESVGHNAIVGGFQGQRQWTDHFPNGDFMETLLNSQYDWNGIRNPYIFATENDALNGVTMLFNYLLTNTPQIFADVRTYWSPEAVERVTGHKVEGHAENGFLHLINSGSCTLDGTGQASRDGEPVMKPYWELSEDEAKAMYENTVFPAANREYFRGGGFSTRFLTKGGMPVTMARLNFLKGVGPVLQIAEGYTLELPEEVHNTLDMRTDPGWPTTWFAPRLTGKGAFKSVYDVMNNWGANHGAISYGHIGADLITLASMLRIPVNMHNVPEEDIFRPKDWSLYGTENLEAADYRACKTLGPVYK
ncbi:L-fucose isomerase [Aerococcaceae bacterium zg-ZJ1578]|uniref:L-fucose isomerase n=1 Tax=Aerococcaceae TaxID=186827 RepID=UPI0013B742CD|nr:MULTISPECIES: L-fucose isomerase [unclassified Facklamia]MBK0347629.1 L-fucose isomerase [Aerococcaceae bacterium zg-1578]MBR7927369.1 L-fucose isomerase [Aerococcaceae bacterium zg-ZUI334]MBS4461428.1 L-fucose isomerase [Aerococcaceae bacterium zg-B36]QQD65806.1 L-fucose isomerase [Aerococcaceae bacterium zg-252]NEW64099.1 L-fucose isomerase [Facklamia sp. 252]